MAVGRQMEIFNYKITEKKDIFVVFCMKMKKSGEKIWWFQKKSLPLHSLLGDNHSGSLGEMVEWSITAVLKTAVPRGTGGSNPSLSAK